MDELFLLSATISWSCCLCMWRERVCFWTNIFPQWEHLCVPDCEINTDEGPGRVVGKESSWSLIP